MGGDFETNIQEIKDQVKQFVDKRDWNKYHHPKELAISISLEAAELLELFQWKDKENIEIIKKDKHFMQNIEREIADILIYSINLVNQLDIDLSQAVFNKIRENNEKYPIEIVKGKSNKYNEYG